MNKLTEQHAHGPEEFKAARTYLQHKSLLDKDGRAIAPPPKAPRVKTLWSRKRDQAEALLISPELTRANVTAVSATYITKGATSLAKVGSAVGGLKIADAGASGASGALGGVALASNSVKLHQTKRKKKRILRELAGLYALADAYSTGINKSPEAARAYRDFKRKLKQVLRDGRHVGLSRLQKQSEVDNEKLLLAGNITRYATTTASSIVSVAGAAANAGGTVTPVGGFLAPVVAVGDGIAAYAAARQGRRQTRSLDAKLAAVEAWRFNQKKEGAKEEGAESGLPVRVIAPALSKRISRQRRLANWTRRGAKVQVTKAALHSSLSVGGAIALTMFLTGVVLTGLATAGAALLAAASVVSGGYMAFFGWRLYRKARTERHAEREQRQAQALLATNSQSEVRRLMDGKKHLREVVTMETRGWPWNRKEVEIVKTVDPAKNSYLSLELMARSLSRKLDETAGLPDGDPVVDLLTRASSRGEAEVLCNAARAKDGADRVAYLKKEIAFELGIPFVSDNEGREKPLPNEVYRREVEVLQEHLESEQQRRVTEPDMDTVKSFFKHMDYKAFARFVRDPSQLNKWKTQESLDFARALVRMESGRRKTEAKKLAATNAAAA